MAYEFRISGKVIERGTGRPLAGLVVRAFDQDLVFHDRLGFATTNASGRFEIRFTEEAFRDFRETRPDVFLRVFDAAGSRLLVDTSDRVRTNAKLHEEFEIEVPVEMLGR